MGLREKIFKTDDLPLREVQIPEWGGTFYVRSMMGDERETYEEVCYGRRSNGSSEYRGMKALLTELTLTDSAGKRIFQDGDATQINTKNASVINRIADAALDHNGFTAADVEDLVKNSEGGQSAASGSSTV